MAEETQNPIQDPTSAITNQPYAEPMTPQELKDYQTKLLGISTQMTPMMAMTQMAHGSMINPEDNQWTTNEAKQLALKHFLDHSQNGSVTPWAREPAIRDYFQKNMGVDVGNSSAVKKYIKTNFPHLS